MRWVGVMIEDFDTGCQSDSNEPRRSERAAYQTEFFKLLGKSETDEERERIHRRFHKFNRCVWIGSGIFPCESSCCSDCSGRRYRKELKKIDRMLKSIESREIDMSQVQFIRIGCAQVGERAVANLEREFLVIDETIRDFWEAVSDPRKDRGIYHQICLSEDGYVHAHLLYVGTINRKGRKILDRLSVEPHIVPIKRTREESVEVQVKKVARYIAQGSSDAHRSRRSRPAPVVNPGLQVFESSTRERSKLHFLPPWLAVRWDIAVGSKRRIGRRGCFRARKPGFTKAEFERFADKRASQPRGQTTAPIEEDGDVFSFLP